MRGDTHGDGTDLAVWGSGGLRGQQKSRAGRCRIAGPHRGPPPSWSGVDRRSHHFLDSATTLGTAAHGRSTPTCPTIGNLSDRGAGGGGFSWNIVVVTKRGIVRHGIQKKSEGAWNPAPPKESNFPSGTSSPNFGQF